MGENGFRVRVSRNEHPASDHVSRITASQRTLRTRVTLITKHPNIHPCGRPLRGFASIPIIARPFAISHIRDAFRVEEDLHYV